MPTLFVVSDLHLGETGLARMFHDLTGFTWETELPNVNVRGAPMAVPEKRPMPRTKWAPLSDVSVGGVRDMGSPGLTVTALCSTAECRESRGLC